MRLIKPGLAFVLLATLVGCGHQAQLPAASQLAMARVQAREVKNLGPERAKEIVTAKFTEANTQVVSVEAKETVTPMIYDFSCTYRRAEFGKICLYVAKGQVDTDSEKIRSTHRVSACLGAERI